VHQHNIKKNMEFVQWFSDVGISDVNQVGGKNASLGEMIRHLTDKGIHIPYGFCTTAHAYRTFLKENKLEDKLANILRDIDPENLSDLREKGRAARALILNAKLPSELAKEILERYRDLSHIYIHAGAKGIEPSRMDQEGLRHRPHQMISERRVDVAVRSSATAEDLPTASFAGQQETFLNVHGDRELLHSCIKCYASLFTDRAISYRISNGFDHMDVALSIGIQKMIRSDLASAGVIFTINTENGFSNMVTVTGSFGLGETVVQGSVTPDEFQVFKPTLRIMDERGTFCHRPIIQKNLGSKEVKMIYSHGGSKLTRTVPVSPEDRKRFCLEDDEILELSRWSCIIEDHYSQKNGKYTPMDIEWAKDGETGRLCVVQARPETVQSQKSFSVIKTYSLTVPSSSTEIITRGISVGEAIASGKACVLQSANEINRFERGKILVTNRTDPDWEPIMKIACAIVTNQGGSTSHAAIIAREMGIPALVGCSNATELIFDGDEVTVNCAEGREGFIHRGLVEYRIDETKISEIPDTKTKIMMNIASPEEAISKSFIPNSGVGLARLEFIFVNHIQIHPNALLHFHHIEDKEIKSQIRTITKGYEKNPPQFFVDKLASGIAMIAGAFYPKNVIIRFSDLKTNEYSHMIGGKIYEPHEENPMLGWRGASRYYHANYSDAFALECEAVVKVRNQMGMKNVIPMIPFVRTPKEAEQVLSIMAQNGLTRGEDDLKVYMMCEIPSNIILAEEFCKHFDGFSIGSNDLTQLTLGIDRDSGIIASIFDERDPSVLNFIEKFITVCKKNDKKIGICGEAPSKYIDFAKFLVDHGIDSISLNSDSVVKTILEIHKIEDNMSEFC
jgi:pyruvate,water dikinase